MASGQLILLATHPEGVAVTTGQCCRSEEVPVQHESLAHLIHSNSRCLRLAAVCKQRKSNRSKNGDAPDRLWVSEGQGRRGCYEFGEVRKQGASVAPSEYEQRGEAGQPQHYMACTARARRVSVLLSTTWAEMADCGCFELPEHSKTARRGSWPSISQRQLLCGVHKTVPAQSVPLAGRRRPTRRRHGAHTGAADMNSIHRARQYYDIQGENVQNAAMVQAVHGEGRVLADALAAG